VLELDSDFFVVGGAFVLSSIIGKLLLTGKDEVEEESDEEDNETGLTLDSEEELELVPETELVLDSDEEELADPETELDSDEEELEPDSEELELEPEEEGLELESEEELELGSEALLSAVTVGVVVGSESVLVVVVVFVGVVGLGV